MSSQHAASEPAAEPDGVLVTFQVLEARLFEATARGRTVEAAAIRLAIEQYEQLVDRKMRQGFGRLPDELQPDAR